MTSRKHLHLFRCEWREVVCLGCWAWPVSGARWAPPFVQVVRSETRLPSCLDFRQRHATAKQNEQNKTGEKQTTGKEYEYLCTTRKHNAKKCAKNRRQHEQFVRGDGSRSRSRSRSRTLLEKSKQAKTKKRQTKHVPFGVGRVAGASSEYGVEEAVDVAGTGLVVRP